MRQIKIFEITEVQSREGLQEQINAWLRQQGPVLRNVEITPCRWNPWIIVAYDIDAIRKETTHVPEEVHS
ncbi:MAG: hypothetical protein AAB442_02580 [Patescibacteria group bacterium]